jgi:hypothetical protein
MRHRPILVDVMGMTIDDHQMADTEVLLEGLDVSAILASAIGRDDDAIVSFLANPDEFPEVLRAVQEHPEVNDVTAELPSGFDWADAIRDGLAALDDPDEIASAWNGWLDAWEVHGGASWADLKWTKRADEIAGWLRIEERPSSEVLEGIARALLDDPAFRSAIVAAARNPRTGGLDALRACSAIEAAEAARKAG